ncbi:rhodanese-like domain-containing protein [Rhodococcus hoagii]|jgi:rhodanese-related sulfurtransferase|nr:lipoprotein [Prescottella equi NBRC 101255 = C 7]MBM4485532.1 rhodanese-like domain-containing protein [Prescottella equi]NKR48811.1 rhodanese-like domain-containing protein [Prescottella equi]NKR63991.1 rhodanese-like domain-containing protein [Prescottella equi]NKR79472.1 rhodanese-like domain-containing protein [Prescottella equi]
MDMRRTLPGNRFPGRLFPGRLAAAAACAGIGATLLAGCGTDGGDAPATSPRLVDVREFADIAASDDTFVLNVHVPDEGTIAGTDGAIPFDALAAEAAALPSDHGTTIAVYCMSGNMSATAVQDLADLGYTDVVELDGGMMAWMADGRELLPPAA